MKRYKILKYPWHTGHDYELSKLDHDFFYLTSTYRRWSNNQRPIPSNLSWVSHHKQVDADVMLLHLDQWSYLEPSKRFLFLSQKNSFDGPKIVIIHGCNMVDGCTKEEMRTLTEGCTVVCNSSTSLKLWDLPDAKMILHGFTPEEWPQTNYQDSTPLIVQPYRDRWQKTANRDFVKRIEERLKVHWVGRDSFYPTLTDYKEFLSQHSIFLNPSHASANPRARAEAMLMGLVPVTTASHDETQYIENGVNGFASDNEEELIEYLLTLIENKKLQQELGAQARKTAQGHFHIDRFKNDWNNLLHDLIN